MSLFSDDLEEVEVFGRGLLFVKECSVRMRPKSYSLGIHSLLQWFR